MEMSIEKCYLYGSCKCQTAGCVVLPDEGCPVYRYFKDLIIKDYENRLKADMAGMLNELQYDLYHGLCKEIHGKEDCPCTNQTTSCLATFRVCDANRSIDKVIQQKIDKLKE